MSAAQSQSAGHAALMDQVYRGQRHIYDLTRKYYLFGRDGLIAHLDAQPGASVLEIACGTGRNLAAIGSRWEGSELHGLDISEEMLKSARATLGSRARLARGDACRFDPVALFGRETFERIVLSYSLSMIPDWEAALRQAAALVEPGGSLHIVDFGSLAGMPRPLASLLRRWLARFHVAPRSGLRERLSQLCDEEGLVGHFEEGPWCYFQRAVLHRPTN
ncbi:MAG: class I SAM-dependent methyltransferase [Erythrobacter sp.]|jgi:S-adenosylmethionine-diacylgycerolhomoserine-N-methlytransferase